MEAENESKTDSSKSFTQKEKIKNPVSVRFHLQLTDSTDRSFPEFSYLELLGVNKYKKKEEDILHDGECNMDEMRALAKKFEDKYGPKSSAKKSKARKTDRVQDLVDVTYGYDATDAFVDDSEAYDELVPADWTTEHGGFYINMGELNFRPISSGDEKSDGDFKESKKKKTPKRKNKENKEKKLKDSKRHLSSGEKEKSSKKMRLNSDEKEGKQHRLKKPLSIDGKSNSSKETAGAATQQDKEKPSKALSIGSMNLQSPVIKLEKNSITELRNSVSNNISSALMENSYNGKENENSSPSVTLPDGLPPSLILNIQKLIEAARKAGGEAGKCKFFNSDVNRILLQIETDSRKLNCRSRSAVYDYLALFLPCTKDTLLKRAKNLFMQEQVGRLREPLVKLRLAIEAAMPAQVKHYEEEVAKLSEEQTAQSQKPFADSANQNGEKKDDVAIKDLEVDGEHEKIEESTTPTDVNAPTTPSEDKGKRAILPKRFVWKDDIRNLLCDVVSIKVELYLMSKSRSTTAEEALKGFLETEVRPLWPKGWMTTRILYRESRLAHAKVTSTIVPKVKKEAKRTKEEEGKSLDSNQQVTSVVSGLKNGEGTNTTNIPTSTVSVTSDVVKSTTMLKTPGAVRPDALNISTHKRSIQIKPSIQSKTDVPDKLPVQIPSQTKPAKESRVLSSIQLTKLPDAKMQGEHVDQSQIKPQNETQLKLQGQIQLKPQPSIEIKHQDQTLVGAIQSRTQEITLAQNTSETLVKTSSQDTPQSQTLEKSYIQAQGSVLLKPQGKLQAEPHKKNLNTTDQLNLKILNQSPDLSFHGEPPVQLLPKPSSQPQNNSLLKPQSAVQNHVSVQDKVPPETEEENSLRKLLEVADFKSKDQSNKQLQDHLQNQTAVQSKGSAHLQGQGRDPLHGHRPTVQNGQSKPYVQPHLQSITQQTVLGKGRGQSLPQSHAHQIQNQSQGQHKSPPFRQSQLETQNRIQSQIQALAFTQSQIRGKLQGQGQLPSQLQGQLQGQFHGSPRDDQGHLLSQVQIKSPSSPRLPCHTNSPNNHRMSSISFSSPTNVNKQKGTGKTILDFLDSQSRNTQPLHTHENMSLSHVTSTSSPLSSCSFQNSRNVKTPNSMSSPPLSSPNRQAGRNISPIRQMSKNTGAFNPNNISPPKRLSSCSLQNIPSKLNQETPPSPRSPRQGYNFMNKVPSSPNIRCQFPMQPSRSSPDIHQRTSHLNTHASNFMSLSSSDTSNTQMTATSLLNSLASISQNHMTPNSPLIGQSSHPLQNDAPSMSNNSLNIPPVMNMQNNVPNNKPQGTSFPGNMKNFSPLPHQFPNQQSMHLNNLPTELNDGSNRIPNFQSTYRPFS